MFNENYNIREEKFVRDKCLVNKTIKQDKKIRNYIDTVSAYQTKVPKVVLNMKNYFLYKNCSTMITIMVLVKICLHHVT